MIEKILEQYIPERFVSDARYRRGHIRVINPLPGTRVLGLHIPDMRKAAAELTSSADRAAELIRQFEAAPERSLYYEEYMVWGMMLNRMKMPLEERLDRLRAFVPHIDNWAVCDHVCAGAKWSRPGDRPTWAFILEHLASHMEFEVRYGLILYMSRMMEESTLPEIFRLMEGLDLPPALLRPHGHGLADGHRPRKIPRYSPHPALPDPPARRRSPSLRPQGPGVLPHLGCISFLILCGNSAIFP